MRTKLYIVAILSVMATLVNAQTFQPATMDNNAIQSQQIMQTSTRYNGQVYEPFSSATPSEQSAVGAASSPNKVANGPRKDKIGGPESGQSTEFPIGDAVLPMLALALLFCGVIALRRKRAAKQ